MISTNNKHNKSLKPVCHDTLWCVNHHQGGVISIADSQLHDCSSLWIHIV